MSRLKELERLGQAVWLDYIRRHLVRGGELARLVREDGLRGVTSNPTIFEKAISGSTDYEDAIRRRADEPADDVVETLAIEDIQAAAGVLAPVHQETDGADGFVCFEVSPHLAHDTEGTIGEARRLWQRIDRPNIMIKVPATPEGLPAIRQLLAEGINVNITLLFSREVYRQVAEAHLAALEERRARGQDIGRIASVASFFVSRIDVAVDPVLEDAGRGAGGQPRVRPGTVAIANARLAYQDWKARVAEPRWQALAAAGARPQRLLWASTSTKDPRLPDLHYAEALIGPDTIDTMTPATLAVFREHGRAAVTLEDGIAEAHEVLGALPGLGIDLDAVTARLTEEGVESFIRAFDKLARAVEAKQVGARRPHIARLARMLPAPLAAEVEGVLRQWQAGEKVRRLWTRDAGLWTGGDEARWLDWLDVADDEGPAVAELGRIERLADEVRRRGVEHVALLGMGGSSLCPDLLARTFGRQPGWPELVVLDSTDPAEIRALERRVDLAATLFVVSSKSGTTLEPNLLADYFYRRVSDVVGEAEAGVRFVAITDPGSRHLQEVAAARGYLAVVFGRPGVGGRYSALTVFGLLPGALMGLDVRELVARAQEMAHATGECVPVADNPGVVLGAILGAAAAGGCDKVTLVTSPGLREVGGWLEQLLAESTGKQGRGVVPVDGESLGGPEVYGSDRLFAYLRLGSAPDAAQDRAIERLAAAGQPVVRLDVPETMDVGQVFFQWEIATAVAGSILGINPFDQPDVEASKLEARALTERYEQDGALPQAEPVWAEGPLALFAAADGRAARGQGGGGGRTLAGILRANLGRLVPGDYFALLAYVPRTDETRRALEAVRLAVRDRYRVATCVGFGPRYLHSTGQAYKGGPPGGVFLELTCDPIEDVPVPGRRLSFGVVEAAQALGDLAVLGGRGRTALRLHLGRDLAAGLAAFTAAVRAAAGG